jgi:hypothetical protein
MQATATAATAKAHSKHFRGLACGNASLFNSCVAILGHRCRMSSRTPHVAELLLLERYAAYCINLAENCKRPRIANLLRSLAADFTIERDKHFRLLLDARTKRERTATILEFRLLNNRNPPSHPSPSAALNG